MKQAAGAYNIVHKSPKEKITEEKIKVVKKAFTEDETSTIEVHFAQQLEEGKPITPSDTKEFCTLYPGILRSPPSFFYCGGKM